MNSNAAKRSQRSDVSRSNIYGVQSRSTMDIVARAGMASVRRRAVSTNYDRRPKSLLHRREFLAGVSRGKDLTLEEIAILKTMAYKEKLKKRSSTGDLSAGDEIRTHKNITRDPSMTDPSSKKDTTSISTGAAISFSTRGRTGPSSRTQKSTTPKVRRSKMPRLKHASVYRRAYRKKQTLWHKMISLISLNRVLVSMAAIVFVVGLVTAINSFNIDRQRTVSANPSTQARDNSNNNLDVDEEEPDESNLSAYSVAPDMPKYLYIPKFGVKSKILQLGLDKEGRMDTPKNIFDTAWYKYSAKPGDPAGAALMAGHVSGPTKPGSLKKLKDMNTDDIFEIEMGDGSKFQYKVVSKKSVPAGELDMSEALLPVNPDKPGLNIITCTGKFDSKTKTYEDRVIVFSERI